MIVPVAFSRLMSFQVCSERSSETLSPRTPPGRNSGLGLALTAFVTKILSPQMIGDEWPSPSMGVFQRTLVDRSPSQAIGGDCPSATPDAPGPRNDGQLIGDAAARAESTSRSRSGET